MFIAVRAPPLPPFPLGPWSLLPSWLSLLAPSGNYPPSLLPPRSLFIVALISHLSSVSLSLLDSVIYSTLYFSFDSSTINHQPPTLVHTTSTPLTPSPSSTLDSSINPNPITLTSPQLDPPTRCSSPFSPSQPRPSNPCSPGSTAPDQQAAPRPSAAKRSTSHGPTTATRPSSPTSDRARSTSTRAASMRKHGCRTWRPAWTSARPRAS